MLRTAATAAFLWLTCLRCWAPTPDTPVPEPGSLALVGIALAAVVYFSTRNKK